MNRIKLFGVAIAMVAMIPVSASALGLQVVNVTSSIGPVTAIENGSTVTVDLVLENATAEQVFGLGLGVGGYDTDANGLQDNGLSFSSAQVSSMVLAPVTGLGGISNSLAAPVFHGNFNPIFPQFNEEAKVTIFSGISLSPAFGDGTQDLGVGGGLVGSGDVHLRVQFLATAGTSGAAWSTTNVEFGVFGDVGQAAVGNGGVDLPFSNATVALTIVPEPGTALLMGLGLAGLATTRRR